MPDPFSDPVFQKEAPAPPKSAWRSFVDSLFSHDFGETADYVSEQVARGVADIPGYIGDAVLNPIRDLGDIPEQAGEIYKGLTGKLTPEDVKKAIRRGARPGVASGPINKAVDEHLTPEEPQDAGDRYLGAAARGVVGNAPFAVEVPLTAIFSGLGMGVGSEAGSDLFPDSPLAPLVGGLVGGVAGGIPLGVKTARTGMRIRGGASDPDFPRALDITMESESRHNRAAVSPKGARSEMQVMPGTARDPGFGIRPSDGSLADDARVGRQYFATLLNRYGHDYEKTWAAYNWGPGSLEAAVKKHGDLWYDHAPKETQDYVAKNMIALKGGPELHGPMGPDDLPTNGSVVPIDSARMASILQDEEMMKATTPERLPKDIPMDEVLTPAERQEMDAAVDKPAPMDSSHEKFTPYIDTPIAANDATLDAIGEYKRIHGKDVGPFTQVAIQTVADERGLPRNEVARAHLFGEDDHPLRQAVMAERDKMVAETDAPQDVKDWYANLPDRTSADIVDMGGKGPPRKPPQEPPSGGEPPPGEPPAGPNDVIQRLIDAINEAKPIRHDMDRAVSREKARRLSDAQQVGQYTAGEEGFHAELSQLKGEMPKADFTSVRDKFSQEDVNHLFDLVKHNPKLTPFDKINARSGLSRLMGAEAGAVPTPSQLKLLAEVFPQEMIDGLLNKRKFSSKFSEHVTNALNVPRAIMASFDISAPGRQGIFFIGRKAFWTSLDDMIKAFGSEEAYQKAQDAIAARPTYPLMRQAKLALTGTSKFLSEREEAFISAWSEKIPGVKMSDRAYVAYLNQVRADVFDDLLKKGEAIGKDWHDDPKALKDLGRFINAATGRGSLWKFNQAAPLLANLFFSPRLIASRLTLLNPDFYIRLDPFVRKEALKSLFSFAAIAVSTLSLAAAGGMSVDHDPRSSDFAKARIGKTRFDILGGFQQYIRAAAQLITGKTVNADTRKVSQLNTGKWGSRTRADVVSQLLTNKESPVASFVHDLLRGSNAIGQENDFKTLNPSKNAVMSRFVPLIAQDTIDAVNEYGAEGAAVAVPAAVGIGVQTYDPAKGKRKTKGKPKDPFSDDVFKVVTQKSSDPFNDEVFK